MLAHHAEKVQFGISDCILFRCGTLRVLVVEEVYLNVKIYMAQEHVWSLKLPSLQYVHTSTAATAATVQHTQQLYEVYT